MQSLLQSSKPSLFLIILRYLGIIILTGIVVGIQLFFFPGVTPFFLFLPTIIFMAVRGGFPTGFLTTFLSIVITILFLFFPLADPLLRADFNLLVELNFYTAICLFLSYTIHRAKQQDKVQNYQKRLRQSTHLIETLEKNYASAQKEIKARDQFLAIASHELKTPVTSMILQVQTAIHNIRNVSLANFSVASLLKMLESTEQQSKRLSKMVNDLLNLSLITTGRLDLEPEETDLTAITIDVTERFSIRLQENQIILKADKPVVGHWDKVRLEQAVINLISNAIKYGNNKPITVSVSNSNNRAKLSVQDQGIGISPDQRKRIFERFERAVSPKEYKGLGVGLFITNEIIKAHNGKITLESKPHQGTMFLIELPLKI